MEDHITKLSMQAVKSNEGAVKQFFLDGEFYKIGPNGGNHAVREWCKIKGFEYDPTSLLIGITASSIDWPQP